MSKFTAYPINALGLLRILAITSILSLVIFVSVTQQVSNDFWLQAKIGELILSEHQVPETVLFPFTEIRDAPFNSHEWLPSIAFSLLLKYGGEGSLPYVSGILGCILFILTTRLAYLKSNNNLPLALALGMLAIAAENYRHILRPELLSLILLVACLGSLHALMKHQKPQSFVLYCIYSLLWANTHGSFILAPLLPLACAAGIWLDRFARIRSHSATNNINLFLGLTLAAFLCSLVNPSGFELWKFAIGFSDSSNAKSFIIEWIPTLDSRVRGIRGMPIGLTVMAAGFFLLWRARHRISHADVLVFFIFVILGFKALRFLVYIGIATAYAAACFESERPSSSQRPLVFVLSISMLLWLAVVRFGNAFENYPYTTPDAESLTPSMVKVLADPEIQGNTLVSYELGAELIYRTYPRIQPSIDSRLDSYGDEYFMAHEILFSNHSLLQAFVQRYDVKYILCQGQDFNNILNSSALKGEPWRIRARDHKAVLLERTAAESANIFP